MITKCFAVMALIAAATPYGARAQSVATGSSVSAGCREEKARSAIGEPYSDEWAERARQTAGAGVVRRVQPGEPDTMQLRADRLNLEVDQSGIIKSVRCG